MLGIVHCGIHEIPETVGRQFIYQGCLQLFTHHHQKGDHNVLIALVIVKLMVDQRRGWYLIFLKHIVLLIWHSRREEPKRVPDTQQPLLVVLAHMPQGLP